jgi:transposase
MTIPGVDRVVAETVIAELGVDMNVFPTVAHAAAWTGVCPGNHESAGKRMGQRKRRGNVHLATALIQAAFAASRAKNTYLKARFWKIAGRSGKKRAAVAVAHSILKAVYQMLKASVDYKDLGADYLDLVPQPSHRAAPCAAPAINGLRGASHVFIIRAISGFHGS